MQDHISPDRLTAPAEGHGRLGAFLALIGQLGGRVAAVGAERVMQAEALALPGGCVSPTSYADLDRAFLDRVAPRIVVAPLFALDFDILDLIQRLAECGYRGSVVALSDPIPNAKAVLAEVRSNAGGLDVHLLELAGTDG